MATKTTRTSTKRTKAARSKPTPATVRGWSHPWLGKYIVMTTQTRPWAVVAGTFESERLEGGRRLVTLRDARMIVWYATGTRSILGLAARGPAPGSRVSPVCEACEYDAIEGLHLATAAARAAIEAEPWE